jgi:anti-sigma-K factor RskA
MIPDDPQEQHLLIAEYVLGLHDAKRQQEIAAWLDRDEVASHTARQWREYWLGAAQLLEPDPLPPRLWRRVARKAGLTRPWWQLAWQSPGLWRTVSASLLLAVALLLGPLREPAPEYTVILQAPGEAASPGWRITVSKSGDLQLTPLVDSHYAANHSVQFWTLQDPAAGPRSLGLVEPGRPALIPASQVGGVQGGQLFELTLEPPGGSPGARPTGPILYIGRAVAL